MTKNQLPEGVGKKIVEALKRQAEADITPVSTDNQISNNISLSDTQEIQEANIDALKEAAAQSASESSFIIEEDANTSSTFNVQDIKQEVYSQPITETVDETPIFKASAEPAATSFNVAPQNVSPFVGANISLKEESKSSVVSSVPISIPTNVTVLKNLIASLPVGVTKQMGAQIIRQTLEAMGLPMSSVLKEAQEVQEELNTNTRECMSRIQEFKTNIMQLEQSVQEYQKNITQINDLVSLFLLTDRK